MPAFGWKACPTRLRWLSSSISRKTLHTIAHFSADEDPSERGIPLDPITILPEEFAVIQLRKQLGPATYKGLTWVGRIGKISMTVWAQDEDGRAIRQGSVKNLMEGDKLEIHVGDFLPPPYNGTISVDLSEFRELLASKIGAQALFRCQCAVEEYNKAYGR